MNGETRELEMRAERLNKNKNFFRKIQLKFILRVFFWCVKITKLAKAEKEEEDK